MHAAFLGPFEPIPLPPAAIHRSPMGGGGRATNVLPFDMQRQEQEFWCWAATTSSVSRHFNSASPWDQCEVASASLGSPCCSAPQPCDQPYTLDDPLSLTGNLYALLGSSDVRSNIELEINAGRPVCCHISWMDGSGHFVAVTGYDWNTDDVVIDDPLYGQQTVPFDTFVSSYRGTGSWDFTYYTQP